jgi:DNA modification methylase
VVQLAPGRRDREGAVIDDVHHGSCLLELPRLPEHSVDLVFADLPYGRTRCRWDRPIDLASLWRELRRVCRPTTPMVFTAIQPFASELVVSNRRAFRYEVIWKKNKSTGFLNAKRMPLRVHEDVLVFYDRQPRYEPQMTTGHAAGNSRSATRISRSSCYGDSPRQCTWRATASRYPTSVLEISVLNNDDPRHVRPAQKPEDLPAWFIRTYTKPGDLVLDPAVGCGSSLLAAKRLGRHFVGFDVDPEMVEHVRSELLAISCPGE